MDGKTKLLRVAPHTTSQSLFVDPLAAAIRFIANATEDVAVYVTDVTTLKHLHLPILAARFRGLGVCVQAGPRVDSHDYRLAIRSTIAVGAKVAERTHADAHCTNHPVTPSAKRALNEFGIAFEILPNTIREYGDCVLTALAAHAEPICRRMPTSSSDLPTLVQLREEKICEALRSGVSQYKNSPIHYETINVHTVKPLTTYLDLFKLYRLRALRQIEECLGVQPGWLILGSAFAITPPVLERNRNGDCVIIDGAHRLFESMLSGSVEQNAVVVDESSEDLPAVPVTSWDCISVSSKHPSAVERYAELDEAKFRDLHTAYAKAFGLGAD